MTIRPISAAIFAPFRAAVITGAALLLFSTPVLAQTASTPPPIHPIEVAFDFNYIRSNAPVAGCGCFSLLGGSASAAYYMGPQFAVVAEFSKSNNDNVDNTTHELTLTHYLIGARALFPYHHSRLIPFGQVLLGVGHESGGIAQLTPTDPGTYSVFAASFGGGVDYRITPHFTWRAAKVDYLLTDFPNRSNNHQNNLRIATGLAMRF